MRSLAVAILAALALMAVALGLRFADGSAGSFPTGTASLPLLFAAAGLCTAALLRGRSPAGAWIATVAAAGIAALEVVGVVRAWQAGATVAEGPWLVVVADGALLVAVGIAAVYAARPRAGSATGLVTAWWLGVMAGVAVVALSAAWAVLAAFDAVALAAAVNPSPTDVSPLRTSGRLALGFVALAALGGAAQDLAAPARRAWSRASSPREFPRALGDELLPTAAAMRRRGEEDERARLAADLHARLLPDLRRAAAAAERDGSAGDPVAVGLRDAIEDVEQLMHSRQSIVLQEYGLVAALEWLAERTEQRTSMRVDVDLDGSGVDDPGSVPVAVARAAFRVALLAIDNVVRHAGASAVSVRLVVDPTGLRLGVADDGRGFDGDTARRSGRGLIDMRSAATEVGAGVTIESSPAGTNVEFAWANVGDST
jgi:signal transduction histidine kinase